MEKSTHELKAEFVYLILWERKINSLEITVIIYSKRILKVQNFLPKYPFIFTLETVLKMAKETNKEDVESIRVKVTKHIKKGGEG